MSTNKRALEERQETALLVAASTHKQIQSGSNDAAKYDELRVIQLSVIVVELPTFEQLETRVFNIKTSGKFVIENTRYHGLTEEICNDVANSTHFFNAVRSIQEIATNYQCKFIMGHYLMYLRYVLVKELQKHGVKKSLLYSEKNWIDTCLDMPSSGNGITFEARGLDYIHSMLFPTVINRGPQPSSKRVEVLHRVLQELYHNGSGMTNAMLLDAETRMNEWKRGKKTV